MRRRSALMVALACLVTASPVSHATPTYRLAGAVGDVTSADGAASARYTVTVPGRHVRTSGWLGWPTGGRAPGTLIVAAHGCCDVGPQPRDLVITDASALGTVSVAMDYEKPTTYAPGLAADDLAAAISDLRQRVPSIRRVIVYATSMGGEASGLMIAAHPGLVTDWVVISGVMDLAATRAAWSPTDALQAHLASVVDASVVPADYDRLSPSKALQHRKNLGLEHAWLFYGRLDAVVPLSEAYAMQAVLEADGVPTTVTVSEPTDGQSALADGWHVDVVSVRRSALTASCLALGRVSC